MSFTASGDFGDAATEDGLTQERGMNCRGQIWRSDDPRLDGTANAANVDSFDVCWLQAGEWRNNIARGDQPVPISLYVITHEAYVITHEAVAVAG